MKLLILKTDTVLTVKERMDISESLHTGIRDGAVFLDGNFTYEVVEFDSIAFDRGQIDIPQKDRKERINEMRRRFAEAKRKDVEEALTNENTKD